MSPKHLAFIEEIQDDLKATLLKALDYIQWEKHVQKDSVVFVKPNFTFPYPRLATIFSKPNNIKGLDGQSSKV